MGSVGNRGCIRSRAFTRLVREQTSLDTLLDGDSNHASAELLHPESISENHSEHLGQLCHMPDHHIKSYEYVAQCHEGHHIGHDIGNPVHSSHNDDQQEHPEEKADCQRVDRERIVQGGNDGLCLQHGLRKTERQDHEHREECPHPSLPESCFHVICRASVERILSAFLVELG